MEFEDPEVTKKRLDVIAEHTKKRTTDEIIKLSWSGALIFVFIVAISMGYDEFTDGDKSLGLAIIINLFSIVISFFAGMSFFKK